MRANVRAGDIPTSIIYIDACRPVQSTMCERPGVTAESILIDLVCSFLSSFVVLLTIMPVFLHMHAIHLVTALASTSARASQVEHVHDFNRCAHNA